MIPRCVRRNLFGGGLCFCSRGLLQHATAPVGTSIVYTDKYRQAIGTFDALQFERWPA